MSYKIYTDTACDVSHELLEKWGVEVIPMTFRFEGEDVEYHIGDIPSGEFYQRMREGRVARTAAINPSLFKESFENCVKGGNDLIYIGLSSGLSTTMNSANMAANELLAEYPDRKIICVDSLGASAGQGMLVYLACRERENGADIEACALALDGYVKHMSYWFTVDDLVYLKRGGRVSPTVALMGNLLGIKPVLHVDDGGHLVPVTKIRGRKKAIESIVDKYGDHANDLKDGTVFISHGDCIGDAELLGELVTQRYGAKIELITEIGAVIGAHSGPGTLALFFLNKGKK